MIVDDNIRLQDLARVLGLPHEQMRLDLDTLTFQEMDQQQQAMTLQRVEEMVRTMELTGQAKRSDSPQMEIFWDDCWSKVPVADEAPPFMVKPAGSIARFDGRYVMPKSPIFEAVVQDIIRKALFMHFEPCAAVYEFGCGIGRHLLALGQHLPGRRLFGLDRSIQAVSRVNSLRQLDITARKFDLKNPDWGFQLLPDAGVLTIGALEQVGYSFGSFLRYLLSSRPKICVHLEPIVELYDLDSAFDRVAARYHHARGYLTGFLPALRELEARGQIQIHDVHRARVGATYHEAMTRIVWSIK